jgi:hypothetical protein
MTGQDAHGLTPSQITRALANLGDDEPTERDHPMGFKRGDSVRVTSDNYSEPGSRSFIGATGEVAGTVGEIVAVRLPGETSSTGFGPEELEHR